MSRFSSSGCTTDQGLDPGQEFREGKWLDQVVVAASLEPFDPIVHRALGTQYEHRGIHLISAYLLDETQAIQFGKHDINDGHIVRLMEREMKTVLTIGRMVHSKPFLFQPFDKEGSNLFVILYN
jgi:hypothetical protein